MICIDGTFLTGRYKGQILTTIGVVCNNQIVLLAFAFVENENLDSWYWFLERVKIHVVDAISIRYFHNSILIHNYFKNKSVIVLKL